MRYSYEFKRKCVEMYRQGILPDAPDGVSKKLFTMKQKLPGSQKKRKLPLIKLLIVYFELNWQAYAATIGASQPSVFNFFRYAFILRSLLN